MPDRAVYEKLAQLYKALNTVRQAADYGIRATEELRSAMEDLDMEDLDTEDLDAGKPTATLPPDTTPTT